MLAVHGAEARASRSLASWQEGTVDLHIAVVGTSVPDRGTENADATSPSDGT